MIYKVFALPLLACLSIAGFAQTHSTLSTETGNNTSACSADGTPAYCTETLPTLTSNSNYESYVQTYYLSPTPGHVSPLTIQQSYLYSGATTRIVAAYQPWFAPQTGGSYNCYPYPEGGLTTESLHPCTGYSENDTRTIAQQHTTMLARGFTDVSPDWYGNSSSQTFLNQTVLDEASDLSGRCSGSSCPLHMLIMIDKGLITSGMAASAYNSAAAGCPDNSSGQSTTTQCVTSVLEAAYDYIDGNWGRQPYYSTDPVSGYPMSTIFIIEGNFTGPTWSTVWANVKSYMAKYKTPYKIVKQYGNFTEANIDGAYIWPQPLAFSTSTPGTQFCWAWPGWSNNACESYNYIGDYYTQAQKNPSDITMGGLYVGFDGSNNNYNHNIMARQCGQLFTDLSKDILGPPTGYSYKGYSTSNQLPWLQLATWNDYGEATNIENGVDNCWRVATPTITNVTTLNWTQTQTDTTYAAADTIDHFKIWYGSGAGDLTLAQDNVLPSQYCNAAVTSCTGFNLATATYPPTSGSYIYVEQIPKALLFTQMDGGGNGNGSPVLYQGSGGGTVISNIDDPPYTWSQTSGAAAVTVTQDVSSPSKDGGSIQFAMTSAPSYSLAKFESSEIGSNGQYDSKSHFTLDLWVEVSNPNLPQSLEFAVSQAINGMDFPFHFQCDLKGSGFWEVWNAANLSWSNTSAPCNAFAANTFTELTFDVQRTTGNELQYNWLKVNGQQYNINQSFSPNSETPDNVNVGVVLHADEAGDLYTVWLDEVTLTMQ